MRKIALKFGLISGAVLASMTAVMVPLCMNDIIDFERSEIIGYSAMVLAFLLVFFGIRSYREGEGNGAITFGRAFKVGILITLIACSLYVVSWEIVYHAFFPDFGEQYSAYVIRKMQERGASAAAIAAEQKEMADFRKLYANPLFNVGITFMEVFPLGLIVTVVCAAILRRKPSREVGARAVVA